MRPSVTLATVFDQTHIGAPGNRVLVPRGNKAVVGDHVPLRVALSRVIRDEDKCERINGRRELLEAPKVLLELLVSVGGAGDPPIKQRYLLIRRDKGHLDVQLALQRTRERGPPAGRRVWEHGQRFYAGELRAHPGR